MRNIGIIASLTALCILLLWLDLTAGDTPVNHPVFYSFRLPRVISAATAGMGLAISGLAMQTLFRNPLAGPFLTGATPGASFAVAILLMAFPAGLTISWLHSIGIAMVGITGSLLVLLLQLFIQRRHSHAFTLLLSGVLLGYLLGAGTEILQGLAQADQVKSFVMWGLGSFDRVQPEEIPVMMGVVIVSIVLLWFSRFSMDAYLPGDAYATSAGVSVPLFRRKTVILAGLVAGTITGFCGPIGFVGMIAPHFARGLMKSNNHAVLWIPTLLCGMALCLLADLLAHHVISYMTLPTNAICAIIGAPALLWIILRKQ